MIRAIVWKEFREQWVIGLTLIVLGGGLLVGAAQLGDPPSSGASALDVVRSLGLGRLATLMLVVTSGMVCGGALFAAEREAGTMTFLEVLPAARWALWRTKLVAGFALALVQTCVVLVLAAALGLADLSFAGRLVMYGLLAFAWGALGSTLARTTLGSVGIAIPAATIATFVFLVPICLAFAPRGSNFPRPIGWVAFEVLMLLTPLIVSGRAFTAPDRARATRRGHSTSTTRALVWLCTRQLRVVAPVLSAFALAFGFMFLMPEVRAVFVWPPVALVAGVLAGVTAFGDEQAHRIAPFWAEGRLPLGRVWRVKIGLHLLLVLWLLFLVALPSVVRTQFESHTRFGHGRGPFAIIFHERLFDELGPQAWKYLLLPAVYGFATGHLCGLLFRKLVVACGVALMVGGCLSALWGPSLLAGGVLHWQVWLPAVVLLVTARLILRSWTTDRGVQHGPLLRLVGGISAALLAFAVGIGYRVLEVPDDASGAADIAFVNSLPGFDENVAGREFRAAAERYARAAAAVAPEPDRQPGGRGRPRVDERLEIVLRQGWPAHDAELASWLDHVFLDPHLTADEAPWPVMAAGAADKPVGVFESPQLVNTAAATAASLENARRMAVTLLARGLQRQAAGEPGEFLPALRTVMALVRNLRHGSGVLALVVGLEVERMALLAADRWLERFAGPTERLREVIRVLEEGDTGGDLDVEPHYLADRYVLREQMRVPGQWLAPHLVTAGGSDELAAAEADLVSFAWTVPWERERTRRLVGLGFEQGFPGPSLQHTLFLVGRPGAGLFLARNRSIGDVVETERYLRVMRRVGAIKFACRAHLMDRKSTPATLAELVAGGYLRAAPVDPYSDGRAFGYRISPGEELRSSTQLRGGPADDTMIRTVSAGQILVWSVGADRTDQGGHVAPGGVRAEDIVFLVPMHAIEFK
ncbi:hypothetical protein VT84_25895 [Gemmata sp. SH-PL17]|uniref:hypothetical protein n=1 Tax=Gemmata sp. SH-PL17 TaxID=1630693 RepID=UPI00078B52F9|nr:hypothetical protein [Gemmata sp. SH-PL17]AMV27862.1 hypothetical protein VT84_25895 [Gemmata sp. SH-PL17]